MTTHDGNLRQNAVVGLVLFLQHWYWYPMLNFLSLALTPTTLIAVNSKLKVPKSFKVTVKATPSTYKYPELMKKKEEKVAEKVPNEPEPTVYQLSNPCRVLKAQELKMSYG